MLKDMLQKKRERVEHKKEELKWKNKWIESTENDQKKNRKNRKKSKEENTDTKQSFMARR